MTTKEFEVKIQQEIDPELTVRVNPNADDIAGVYWREVYISVAVPSGDIQEEFNRDYTDKMGYPYRSVQMAIDQIKGKLPKFQDPENYKMMTEKIWATYSLK